MFLSPNYHTQPTALTHNRDHPLVFVTSDIFRHFLSLRKRRTDGLSRDFLQKVTEIGMFFQTFFGTY